MTNQKVDVHEWSWNTILFSTNNLQLSKEPSFTHSYVTRYTGYTVCTTWLRLFLHGLNKNCDQSLHVLLITKYLFLYFVIRLRETYCNFLSLTEYIKLVIYINWMYICLKAIFQWFWRGRWITWLWRCSVFTVSKQY